MGASDSLSEHQFRPKFTHLHAAKEGSDFAYNKVVPFHPTGSARGAAGQFRSSWEREGYTVTETHLRSRPKKTPAEVYVPTGEESAAARKRIYRETGHDILGLLPDRTS